MIETRAHDGSGRMLGGGQERSSTTRVTPAGRQPARRRPAPHSTGRSGPVQMSTSSALRMIEQIVSGCYPTHGARAARAVQQARFAVAALRPEPKLVPTPGLTEPARLEEVRKAVLNAPASRARDDAIAKIDGANVTTAKLIVEDRQRLSGKQATSRTATTQRSGALSAEMARVVELLPVNFPHATSAQRAAVQAAAAAVRAAESAAGPGRLPSRDGYCSLVERMEHVLSGLAALPNTRTRREAESKLNGAIVALAVAKFEARSNQRPSNMMVNGGWVR